MKGSGLLQNKKGIIFGALDEDSIAWQTALQVHAEGGAVILTNFPAAIRLGKINELAALINAPVIPCDVAHLSEIEGLIDKTKEYFSGGFDFILHSVGMSYNIRKKNEYTHLDYELYLRTLEVSAFSLHKILQSCYQKNALNDFASVVALSFMASQKVCPGYNDMADAKAVLESIVRNFGYYYGKSKNVRVNSVSQSPTATTAAKGIEGFSVMSELSNEVSPLGNATAKDVAKYICMLFSDYTHKITLQNLYHDGGYSSMGFK